MGHQRVAYLQFSEEEQREIVFKDITTGEVTHTTILDTAGVADYRSVIGYFAQTIMKDLRLVSGYDVLYGKVKAFVQDRVVRPAGGARRPEHAAQPVGTGGDQDADRNLQEGDQRADRAGQRRRRNPRHHQAAANAAVCGQGSGLSLPKKSVFNRIIGDSHFELLFARFLEDCDDVVSYAKNYFAVHFKLDYVNADGDISNYYPDFLVKLTDKRIVIVETKGQEDLDVPLKMERLRQWCEDVNRVQARWSTTLSTWTRRALRPKATSFQAVG